jgi:hypothetical protein
MNIEPTARLVFDGTIRENLKEPSRDLDRLPERIGELDKNIDVLAQDVSRLEQGQASLRAEAKDLQVKLFAANEKKEPLKIKLAASGLLGIASGLAAVNASVPPYIGIPLAAVGIISLGVGAYLSKKLINLKSLTKGIALKLSDLQCDNFSKDTFKTLSQSELQSAVNERKRLKTIKDAVDMTKATTGGTNSSMIVEDEDDQISIAGVKLHKNKYIPQILNFFRNHDSSGPSS